MFHFVEEKLFFQTQNPQMHFWWCELRAHQCGVELGWEGRRREIATSEVEKVTAGSRDRTQF